MGRQGSKRLRGSLLTILNLRMIQQVFFGAFLERLKLSVRLTNILYGLVEGGHDALEVLESFEGGPLDPTEQLIRKETAGT